MGFEFLVFLEKYWWVFILASVVIYKITDTSCRKRFDWQEFGNDEKLPMENIGLASLIMLLVLILFICGSTGFCAMVLKWSVS